ncbi:MAG: hypothetical protein JO254_06740 [Pseudolabrys sp.]|nr:hypothetical protein [Pseudolabrys sp.]
MIVYPLLLSAQLLMVADTVPQFDVTQGCPAAGTEKLLNRTLDACRKDEEGAKATLAGDWSKYPSIDRASCETMIKMGGQPSYVELLTCLELAQQTRSIRQTTGSGGDKL